MSSQDSTGSPTVRFAPSPTGRIHIGNARTAVFNWLFALKHAGRFVLRFDDTDRERSTVEFERAIASDLAWLGIVPDLVVRQSERFDLYAHATERLKGSRRLYPCYETQAELELRRKRQLARGAPPIYDRSALTLTAAERRQLEAAGRRPHWRFLLESRKVRIYMNRAWQSAVIRKLLHGPVTAAAPASLLQEHADARVLATEMVTELPEPELR